MKKTYKTLLKAPVDFDLFGAPVPSLSIGLSKVRTSQTIYKAGSVDNPIITNGRLAYATNQLTIKPHCVTLSKVFVAPHTTFAKVDLSRPFAPFVYLRQHEFRPRGNGFKRFLLPTTARKIKTSIAAMIQGSRIKKSASGGWRVSMVTLTLCALQAHTDKTLNAEALNQFLTVCRRWGVLNYVWVTERQKNGSIHWHLIFDRYVDKDKIRKTWNSILKKLGYLERYTAKHQKMTFANYWNEYGANYQAVNGVSPWVRCHQAYRRGVACGWTNPNSTDVKAARNINLVMSYVSKYMTKGICEFEPDIDGRFSLQHLKPSGRRFGRSESVTALTKFKTYRRGAWHDLNELLQRVIDSLGDAAKVFQNDDFRGVFFEPLTSPLINKLLNPALKAVNYCSG